MTVPLLDIRDLKRYFPVRSGLLHRITGLLRAVDGVSLEVDAGEVIGIVGESGCGKTTLGKTIQGIYRPTDGEVFLEGKPLSRLPAKELRRLRLSLQYVHQDPLASFDPWWPMARSLDEPLRAHTELPWSARMERVASIVRAVGLDMEHLERFPHELSGGQLRRLTLARVLVLNPRVIVLDEPTASLDVSVQARILKLLSKLRSEFNLTYVFISHDLRIVRIMCDRVAVMYLGKVVETGPTEVVLQDPRHPYTRALLAAIPHMTPGGPQDQNLVEGEPPSPLFLPQGCRFSSRCPLFQEGLCNASEPALSPVGPGHEAACFRSAELSRAEEAKAGIGAFGLERAEKREGRKMRIGESNAS
ncbi:MAG: ABC transporter ATP-binding protein [Deltaproteobacteria bacterium]|nr:ABC transporter ATP-binding protein [Deltaproteobacteria bacterium]